jgi:hypothetical protein
MTPRFEDAPYGEAFKDTSTGKESPFQKSKNSANMARMYMDWVMCCVYPNIPTRTSGEVVVPDKDRNKYTINMKKISLMAMATPYAFNFLEYIKFSIPKGIYHKVEKTLFADKEDPTRIFSKQYRDKAQEFKEWFECLRRELMTEVMVLHLDWGTMGRNNYAWFLERCYDDVFDKRANKASVEILNSNVIAPNTALAIEFVEVNTPEEVKAVEDFNDKNVRSQNR